MKWTVLLLTSLFGLSACGGGGHLPPASRAADGASAPSGPLSAPADQDLQPLAIAQAQASRTVVAFYQPTPFAPSHPGTHVLDGWLPSYYYHQKFQADDRLQVGGWGDFYRTYIQFDTTGLPQSVTDATLLLWAYPRGDSSAPTDYNVFTPDVAWVDTNPASRNMSTSLDWGSQKTLTQVGAGHALPVNNFWPIPVTTTYNGWRTTPASNHGLVLTPYAANNNFDVFRSSRYANDAQRPILRLTFQSSAPDFKMPLPRGVSWKVTREVGGFNCEDTSAADKDPAHDGINYFSVDFSYDNRGPNGKPVYGNPDPRYGNAMIPITPAADGTVRTIGTDPNDFDGLHVIIDHAGGYSTRYLHFKSIGPRLKEHDVVKQGVTLLGYMGSTGYDRIRHVPTSTGPHLHFGVRFGTPQNETGAESQKELRQVVVSGWLMKSFQSECSPATGKPDRFYLSS